MHLLTSLRMESLKLSFPKMEGIYMQEQEEKTRYTSGI